MRLPALAFALLGAALATTPSSDAQVFGQDEVPGVEDRDPGAGMRSALQPHVRWTFRRDPEAGTLAPPGFDPLLDTPAWRNRGGRVLPETRGGMCFGFAALTARYFRDLTAPRLDSGSKPLRLRERLAKDPSYDLFEIEAAAAEQGAAWHGRSWEEFEAAWENLGPRGRQLVPGYSHGGQMRGASDLALRVLGDLEDRRRGTSVIGVLSEVVDRETGAWVPAGHALAVIAAYGGTASSSGGESVPAVALRFYDSNLPELSAADVREADRTQLLIYLPDRGGLTFDGRYLTYAEAALRVGWQRPARGLDGTYLQADELLYVPVHAPGLFDRPAARMRRDRGIAPRAD